MAGDLTSETYPSGRVVTTTYDQANRVATLAAGSTTYAQGFGYWPHGEPQQYYYPNTIYRTTVYNSRLQPTSLLSMTSLTAPIRRFSLS